MRVKHFVKLLLQRTLGLDAYLFCFAVMRIYTLRWGRDEGQELCYFSNLLPNRGVVLDIGANVGVVTTLLARRLNNAMIYAFEPIPDNFRALSRVVRFFKLPNVVLFQMALGDKRGKVVMNMPVTNGVKMQGNSHVIGDNDTERDGVQYFVEMDQLDSIEQIQDKEIVSIKIDVEDFERFVIWGGINTIKKHRPIIYAELWEPDNRAECLRILKKMDYHVMILNKDNNKLIPYDPGKHNPYNFFFLP